MQHNTTQYYLSMTDYYTVLHSTALCPSTAISILLFLPLSMTPCSIAPQPQPQLTLAPAPTRRYCTWCSLHDGTLSMHTFFLFFSLFFDTSTRCFFVFLSPLRSAPAVSRFASSCLVSPHFSLPCVASPRPASIGLLRLAMITFASLFFSFLLYFFLFHSIPFYSTVFLFRQRHRLPRSALQRLSTTHLLTGRQTDTQIGHDTKWHDVVIYSTLHSHWHDLCWPMLRYVTWPYPIFLLYHAPRDCTQSYWTWPDLR